MADWLENIDFEDNLKFFNNFLSKCGIKSNEINFNQTKSTNKIIIDLKESLKKGEILSFDQCQETIADIINNKNDFERLLASMTVECEHYSLSLPKSLLQIFLSISELSSFIIDIIIDKVCELSQNDSINDNELAVKCLDQLKWCVSGGSGDTVDRLLDLGYVSSNSVKRHIISILPTVCYGRSNDTLAKKLYEWMNSDNNLISSCLEAINQLDLKDRNEIELLIINLLDCAAMNTLPAMITFLMKCADKNNIISLVDKIRINVSFDNLQTMFSSAVSSTPIEDRSLNCVYHFINSIKINFQFNPNLHKSWLKSISTNPGNCRCQTFDLIVLLIIYDYKDVSASIITIMKSKICKGFFTQDTVETLFKYHLEIIKPLYKKFFEIVNIILNSIESHCCQFVKHVYEQCIKNESDNHTINEMIDVLLIEITSKSNNFVDNKVSILSYLAENCTIQLRQFYRQISELLSVSCKFSNSQVYNIYQIVSILAFNDQSEPNNIKQEITTLIRRQLYNPDLFVRRNGAIGAITVMRQLAHCESAEVLSTGIWTRMWCSQIDRDIDTVSLNSNDQSFTANEKAVSTILKLLMSISEVHPQLSIVIFDELHRLIAMNEMKSVEGILRKMITNNFQDSYVVDIVENSTSFKPLFGLLGTEFCDVAVTISQMKAGSVVVNISLPSQFKLLALCEIKCHNNSLKDINALLGCPIILASCISEAQFLERITVINWLIEVVNAFSLESTYNAMFHSTYTHRLKEIVSQMMDFEKNILEQNKVVKLPSAQIMTGSSLLSVSEIRTCPGKRSNKSKPTKSKKSKTDVLIEIVADDLFEEDGFDKYVIAETISLGKCKILKENLGLCYREFNLSVFKIMTDLIESDFILSDCKTNSLGWHDLNVYLTDLWMKIKHRLKLSPVMFEGVFSQKSSVIYRYVDRIPLDDFLGEIIKLCPLFRKVLSSCICICKITEIFDDENGSCFNVLNLILKSLSHIFNFLIIETEKNEALIAQLMSTLVPRSEKVIVQDIYEFLDELYSLKDYLPTVMTVSSYTILMSTLQRYPSLSSNSLPMSLRQITLEFLCHKWNINEFISLIDYKASISSIFEIFLSNLDDEWCEILQNNILPEMITIVKKNEDPPSTESKYLCLNQNTILGFFKLILDYIIKKCKILSKKPTNERNTSEGLQEWEQTIDLVRTLTNLVANNDEAHTMFAFIKFSRDLMKTIIKDLMPILDDMLRHANHKVIQLLKYIQDVTRFIQRVCIHCKGKKNLQVTSMVPEVRRYLEIFMYRVKKMMCINKCSGESLNILALANKDLHGNRIESSDEGDQEINEDDSELPESDNETVLDD